MKKIFVNLIEKTLIVFILLCYLTFIVIDFVARDYISYSDNIKYFGIISCFLLSFIICIKNKPIEKEKLYLTFAMLFTVFADLFLLFDNILLIEFPYVWGIIAFCIAHLFHKKSMRANVTKYFYMTAIIIVVSLVLLLIKKSEISLIILPICYSILIISNVISSFKISYSNSVKIKRSLGMVLFLCCDICVLIFQILLRADFAVLKNISPAIIVNLSWVFYLPSQFLLTISEDKIKVNKK